MMEAWPFIFATACWTFLLHWSEKIFGGSKLTNMDLVYNICYKVQEFANAN